MRPEWESRKRHPCFVLPVTRSASMSVCFFQSGKVYKVVGHVEHYAGDQMYIDFAGDRFEVVDEMTGETTQGRPDKGMRERHALF